MSVLVCEVCTDQYDTDVRLSCPSCSELLERQRRLQGETCRCIPFSRDPRDVCCRCVDLQELEEDIRHSLGASEEEWEAVL